RGPGGRTHEIQRLVGRSLRAVMDLTALGERSILIDCDVIQADGGTRTASITGGYVALVLALERLRAAGELPRLPLTGSVAAVSAGGGVGAGRGPLARRLPGRHLPRGDGRLLPGERAREGENGGGGDRAPGARGRLGPRGGGARWGARGALGAVRADRRRPGR